MSVARMLKFSLLGYSGIKNKLIEDIHKAGIIEVTEISKEEYKSVFADQEEYKKELSSIENKLQEISKVKEGFNFAIKFLQPYKPKKGLIESLSSDKFVFDDKTYIKIVAEFKYNIIEKIKKDADKISEFESLKKSYYDRIDFFHPWRGLKLDMDTINNASQKIKIFFGSIDSKNFDTFKKTAENIEFSSFSLIHSTKDNKYFSIIYLQDIGDNIQEMINEFSINIADFGDVEDNIPQTVKDYKDKIKNIDNQLKEIETGSKEYANNYNDLLICLDYWSSIYEKEEIKKNFLDTDSSFLIKGWIKKNDIKKIDKIKEKYSEIHVSLEVPDKNDVPPVALENRAFSSPFEVVTKLFGFPTKKDVDPTPFFAPFFALFFGICLTDAGYGLVLVIIGFLMLRNKYLGQGTKNLLKLVIISGIFTVIVGVFAGGFFGIQFEKLPPALKAARDFKDKVAILDPLKNPLRMFGLAIGLGVFQITFGFILKFVLLLKNKEVRAAFVESFSWILIILGVILGVALKNKMVLYAMMGTGALIILLFTSTSKNPLARLGAGLFGLYDITGIFGDIVSYSRLFALALATGVVAMVINIILGIAFGIVAKVPIVIAPLIIIVLVFVLVIAHLFNLGINALGAFVHTTRLQFVEYFTKFYKSGGREFTPFEEKLEYVHLKKN